MIFDMSNSTIHSSRRFGFTLAELAIVLVVIGLIIGGILFGTDLMQSMRIRSTISQIEKYKIATQSFENKYNQVPGDMLKTETQSYGLFTFSNSVSAGDGNGLITNSSGCVGESLAYWRHLSEANLIEGGFGTTGNAALDATTGQPVGVVTELTQSLPNTKMTPDIYIDVGESVPGNGTSWGFTLADKNYFILRQMANIGASGCNTMTQTIKPTDAYAIDQKIDDGLPYAGTVQAYIFPAGAWTAAASGNRCAFGGANYHDAAATYNLTTSTGRCTALSIQMK